MLSPNIGIVGVGMVGQPIADWFVSRGWVRGENLFLRDTNPRLQMNDDVTKADLVFICVPTPQKPDGSCDISIVKQAVSALSGNKLIVIKSTVEPGTTADLQRNFSQHAFIFSPEFLTESQSWSDFIRPSRQIIGTTPESRGSAVDILNLLPQALFSRPWTPIYGSAAEVTATEAEVVKYGSNVFGAIKVTFANIMADACHILSCWTSGEVRYGAVRDMLAADQHIGPAWLDVDHGKYCGFGGFCFPKDLRAFVTFLGYIWQHLTLDGHLSPSDSLFMLRGIEVLKAVDTYNDALLKAQGLTREQVMRHASEIPLHGVKSVRQKP